MASILQTDTAEFVGKMENIIARTSYQQLENSVILNILESRRFLLSERMKSKQDYELDSLKCIQASISIYLSEKRNINIIKDKEFQHS